MKSAILLLVIIALTEITSVQLQDVSSSSQPKAFSPSPRIINGTRADVANTKHQVSIRLKSREGKFGNGHVCGGSLIGPRKVLTAAHCVFNEEKRRYRKANEFSIVMGTMDRTRRVNGTIVSDVTSFEAFGTFNMATMRDDVAVMFLKTGLPANKTHLTIAPIAMANTTVKVGTECQVTGWGKTEKGSLPNHLLTANVKIISRSLCQKSYQLTPGMMCAGSMRGGTDSCKGDSGGPLVHNNTLVGIVSWGNGCALPFYPGVYVDVSMYRTWIDSRNACSKTTCSILSFLLVTFTFIFCKTSF